MSEKQTVIAVAVAAAAAAAAVVGLSHFMGKKKAKEFRPKRIILVRHGESEANVTMYKVLEKVSDNAVHLTQKGFEQGRAAGKELKRLLGDESVRFIVSPTLETFHAIAESFGGVEAVRWSEEFRIREQEFGMFKIPDKDISDMELMAEQFGQFYFRRPNAESSADVFDRVGSFVGSLRRMWSFESEQYDNYVIVVHSLCINVFLARFFRLSVDEFHALGDQHNCDILCLVPSPTTEHPFYDYELEGVRQLIGHNQASTSSGSSSGSGGEDPKLQRAGIADSSLAKPQWGSEESIARHQALSASPPFKGYTEPMPVRPKVDSFQVRQVYGSSGEGRVGPLKRRQSWCHATHGSKVWALIDETVQKQRHKQAGSEGSVVRPFHGQPGYAP